MVRQPGVAARQDQHRGPKRMTEQTEWVNSEATTSPHRKTWYPREERDCHHLKRWSVAYFDLLPPRSAASTPGSQIA
jgi:hypothetical protein